MALASITDNSSSKPYVIKISPGIYTESSTIVMKDYVDIEGSGQNVTTLTCACFGDFPQTTLSATAITAEVRHVTVSNTGVAGNQSFGIFTKDVADGSVSLLHVTATATGGVVNRAVFNNDSDVTMTDLTAIATSTNNADDAYGVFNSSGSPTMTDVTAVGIGGDRTVGVNNTQIPSSSTMTNVRASAVSIGGTDNIGVDNESSSPTMTNVTAKASGADGNNIGVKNDLSSPTMTDVTITATGGINTYGVNNTGPGFSGPNITLSMTDVTVTATGGDFNYGVRNLFASPTMTNVNATVGGGENSYAVHNENGNPKIDGAILDASTTGSPGFAVGIFSTLTVQVLVRNSSIRGDTHALFNTATGDTNVAHTMLDGFVFQPNFTSNIVCIGAYTTSMDSLNDRCLAP